MMDSSSSACDSGASEDDTDTSPDFKKRKTDTDDFRIAAAKQNDLDSLMRLSDATEWYKFEHPDTGNTLLYYAVEYQAKDVFDYLLSFADFPLEHKNYRKETVLFSCLIRWGHRKYDYYACALIKRGAFVGFNKSVLHRAIKNQMVETSKLLMDKGYDVNARNRSGMTPMSLCLYTCFFEMRDREEIALALLSYGADPTLNESNYYNAFELSARWYSLPLQEAFFLSMIDHYTSMDVHLEVVIHLATAKSPFLQDVLQHPNIVVLDDWRIPLQFLQDLLYRIDVDIFEALIKKCPDVIRKVLHIVICNLRYPADKSERKKILDNFNCLLESDFREITLFYMDKDCIHPADESFAIEWICLFLSYGLELKTYHVVGSYYWYGFGELSKTLLRMANEMDTTELRDAFLLLLVDVSSDSKQILEKVCRSGFRGDRTPLLHYFADEGLRALCSDDNRPSVIATIANQPKVPLLVELARNALRKSCVRTFGVTTFSRLYALVDRLHIPTELKKIINFERQLY